MVEQMREPPVLVQQLISKGRWPGNAREAIAQKPPSPWFRAAADSFDEFARILGL
jgi:hypothetical protein